ncbi:uncharacterized protein [Hetaerina americana]|uniref:uncharacterized protein n=1 Tax=Hetaerina americana TaxID=62018 RepID=UPI003A7F2189
MSEDFVGQGSQMKDYLSSVGERETAQDDNQQGQESPAAKTAEDIPTRRTMSFKPPSFISNTAKSLRDKLAGTRTTLSEGGDDAPSLSFNDLMNVTPERLDDLPPASESPLQSWGSEESMDELSICQALDFPCPIEAKLEIARSLKETARRRRAEVEEELRSWTTPTPTIPQPTVRNQKSRSLDSLDAKTDESLESMAASMDTRVPSPPIMDSLSPLSSPPPRPPPPDNSINNSAATVSHSPASTPIPEPRASAPIKGPRASTPIMEPQATTSTPMDYSFPSKKPESIARPCSLTSTVMPEEKTHKTETVSQNKKASPKKAVWSVSGKKQRTPRFKRKGKVGGRKKRNGGGKKTRDNGSSSTESSSTDRETQTDDIEMEVLTAQRVLAKMAITVPMPEAQPKPRSPDAIETLPTATLARDDSIDQFDKDTFQEMSPTRFPCCDVGKVTRRANLRHQCSMDETRSEFYHAREQELDREAECAGRGQKARDSGGSRDAMREREKATRNEPRPPEEPRKVEQKPSEKRRLFFLRKQTNSAPDSMEDHSTSAKPREHHSVSFCLGSRRGKGSDAGGSGSRAAPMPPTIQEVTSKLKEPEVANKEAVRQNVHMERGTPRIRDMKRWERGQEKNKKPLKRSAEGEDRGLILGNGEV